MFSMLADLTGMNGPPSRLDDFPRPAPPEGDPEYAACAAKLAGLKARLVAADEDAAALADRPSAPVRAAVVAARIWETGALPEARELRTAERLAELYETRRALASAVAIGEAELATHRRRLGSAFLASASAWRSELARRVVAALAEAARLGALEESMLDASQAAYGMHPEAVRYFPLGRPGDPDGGLGVYAGSLLSAGVLGESDPALDGTGRSAADRRGQAERHRLAVAHDLALDREAASARRR